MAIQYAQEHEAPQSLPLHLELMSEIATPAVAAATTFQRRLFENMSACQKDWYGFVQSRWQENIAIPRRLARCKTPMDVQQVYMDFWRRALEQYSGEFEHLGVIAHCDGYVAGNPAEHRDEEHGTAPPRTDFRVPHRTRLDA